MASLFNHLLLAATLLYATQVMASSREAIDLGKSGEIIPLEQLLSEVQKSHPGRVIEVEFETKYGRRVYELELLDSTGQVWELYFDAHTGELIKKSKDD